MRVRGRDEGFTLLELMVTVAIAGVLLGVAVPGFITWVNNGKVRSVADQLQNAIRLAQAESLRRSHQVVFALTTGQTAPFTSSTTGAYWAVQTIPFITGETAETIETGNFAGLANRVTVTGSAGQICFNSVGRLTVPVSSPVGGTNCTAALATFNIGLNNGSQPDTPLQIKVGLNGQVHMCNRNKTYSASSAPDGC